MPYLLKYKDNYSDEFDIDGITILTEEELYTLLEQIKLLELIYNVRQYYYYGISNETNIDEKKERYKDFLDETECQFSFELIEEIRSIIDDVDNTDDYCLFSFYFGTNEEMRYDDFNEISQAFSYEQISDEEYEFLRRVKIDNIGYASSFVDSISESFYKGWIWDESIGGNNEQAVTEYNTKIDNIILKVKQELGK